MKAIETILLSAILSMLALTSCQKKQCYTCVTTTKSIPLGAIPESQSSEGVCDKTSDQIQQYEQDHSYSEHATMAGKPVTITHQMNCY